MTGAVVQSTSGIDLLEHGVRTTAKVEDVDHSSKDPQYLLQVVMADGTASDAWMSDASGTPVVGDTIAVAYPPSDPSNVESIDEVGRWWIDPLILVIAAAGFAWFGVLPWRVKQVRFFSHRQKPAR